MKPPAPPHLLPTVGSRNALCPLTPRLLAPADSQTQTQRWLQLVLRWGFHTSHLVWKYPTSSEGKICPSHVAAPVPLPAPPWPRGAGSCWVWLPVPHWSPGRAGAEHPLLGRRAKPPLFPTFFHLPSAFICATPQGPFPTVTLKPDRGQSSRQGTSCKGAERRQLHKIRSLFRNQQNHEKLILLFLVPGRDALLRVLTAVWGPALKLQLWGGSSSLH